MVPLVAELALQHVARLWLAAEAVDHLRVGDDLSGLVTLHLLQVLVAQLPDKHDLHGCVERENENQCQPVHTYCTHIIMLMRDEKEGRKKQARSSKQQGKATQHTQGSHFS